MTIASFGLEPGTHLHFVGVGGSGMLGLAEWALLEGLTVTGSDSKRSAATQRLEDLGLAIRYDHSGQTSAHAAITIHSTAIPKDNPELLLARTHHKQILSRGGLLGELSRHRQTIAVCGSHGKSTTTALLGHCLREHWPAHVYLGAKAHNFGASFHFGDSRRLIAEVDESDGTFLEVHNDLSVLTGLSNDHESHYGGRAQLYDAFEVFLRRSSIMTWPVVCAEDTEVAEFVRQRRLRCLTYGFAETADIWASNLRFSGPNSHFEVHLRNNWTPGNDHGSRHPRPPVEVVLPMLGHHNVLNSLAIFAVAIQIGLPWETVSQAMASFTGVERRLERLYANERLEVFSDYAHNPQKIAAAITTLNLAYEDRVVCVFEPHRYTRLESMWSDFVTALRRAHNLYVLPLYDAGESPIEGVSRDALVAAIGPSALTLDPTKQSFSGILDRARQGTSAKHRTAVVFLGAGKSHDFAQQFVRQVKDNDAQNEAKDCSR